MKPTSSLTSLSREALSGGPAISESVFASLHNATVAAAPGLRRARLRLRLLRLASAAALVAAVCAPFLRGGGTREEPVSPAESALSLLLLDEVGSVGEAASLADMLLLYQESAVL